MARLRDEFNWDQLLDGNPHDLDLRHFPAFTGGLDSVRSLAYRHAERRRHTVTTHKLDPFRLQIQAHDVQPPCDCGAYPGRQHREHCTVVQVSPYPYKPHPMALPPADSTPPPTSEPTEADDEALLGPCTCGQAPTCQPDCFRVNG